MSETATLVSLIKGVRWFAASVIAAAALYSVRQLCTVPKLSRIFEDLLGPDVRLPAATGWLIRSHPYFLMGVIALCVASLVAVLRLKNPGAALCVAGASVLIHVAIWVWTSHALIGPLLNMLHSMNK
jgi:hypothetical protein